MKKFLVFWRFNGGSDELYGYDLEDALKREKLCKSAVDHSRELPMTPEEVAQFDLG